MLVFVGETAGPYYLSQLDIALKAFKIEICVWSEVLHWSMNDVQAYL